jgi:hypothetical protein
MSTFFYVGHAVGLNSQRFFLSAHIFARGFLTATVILDGLRRNSVHRLALALFCVRSQVERGHKLFCEMFPLRGLLALQNGATVDRFSFEESEVIVNRII